MLIWNVEDRDGFTLATYEIPSPGTLSPIQLPACQLPSGLNPRLGLVVGGKGPKWLDAHLAHLAHHHVWVGIVDPRLGGVVVQCHSPSAPPIGSVVDLTCLIA